MILCPLFAIMLRFLFATCCHGVLLGIVSCLATKCMSAMLFKFY